MKHEVICVCMKERHQGYGHGEHRRSTFPNKSEESTTKKAKRQKSLSAFMNTNAVFPHNTPWKCYRASHITFLFLAVYYWPLRMSIKCVCA